MGLRYEKKDDDAHKKKRGNERQEKLSSLSGY